MIAHRRGDPAGEERRRAVYGRTASTDDGDERKPGDSRPPRARPSASRPPDHPLSSLTGDSGRVVPRQSGGSVIWCGRWWRVEAPRWRAYGFGCRYSPLLGAKSRFPLLDGLVYVQAKNAKCFALWISEGLISIHQVPACACSTIVPGWPSDSAYWPVTSLHSPDCNQEPPGSYIVNACSLCASSFAAASLALLS
jgi:hypothetical protein